eukprot:TRINITY_DN1554_c0_g1_i1.p1 TRINITY_DN1554_c0_g1~~TRINITY_DN1554_c0_g1_i1.p1  ORF type:complete len:243 (-),score=29.68 TRINITY_DN1554_c0_g1_i1:848-1576(-)
MASKPSAPLASISPPPSITYFAWRSLDYCLRERKLQLDAAAYTVEEINAAVTGHEPEDDRLSVAIPEAWQAYKSQESGSAIAAAAAENDVLTREEAAEFTRWLAYAASKAVNDHEDPASRRPAQPSDEAFTVKLPGTQVEVRFEELVAFAHHARTCKDPGCAAPVAGVTCAQLRLQRNIIHELCCQDNSCNRCTRIRKLSGHIRRCSPTSGCTDGHCAMVRQVLVGMGQVIWHLILTLPPAT